MTTESDLLRISLPTKSDYISVLRLTVSGICNRMNYTIDDTETIKLAVSEAYTNVIKHAYKIKSIAPTIITIMIDASGLKISVIDHGDGFDIGSEKQTYDFESLDSLAVGMGVGLTFIKSLMDTMTIQSTPGIGTVITMYKKRSAIADNQLARPLTGQ